MSSPTGPALLEVEGLRVELVSRGPLGQVRGRIRAVDAVSFRLERGETLGLVGESGCGKSTLARAVLGLTPAQAGSVRFDGVELLGRSGWSLRPFRRRMQVVFQDPYASLDPRMTVGESIAEGLEVHAVGERSARSQRVADELEKLGLPRQAVDRYPHEFSGGQRQRVAIARALAVQPELVILDEPLSSLDVSVQAQIVNLLQDLQQELGLTFLFIAHDLRMVRHVSRRVAVMYLGRWVEVGPAEEVCRAPRHPYARALVQAVPEPRAGQLAPLPLTGEPPSPLAPPPGCAFHPRCPVAVERCRREVPALLPVGDGHQVACHLAEGGG